MSPLAVQLLFVGASITSCQTHSGIWISHVSKDHLIEMNEERPVGKGAFDIQLQELSSKASTALVLVIAAI